LGALHAKGVGLYLHQQGIDTTTSAGKALFQMCGVFAEFERAMIVERVKAGLARAREQGKRMGRPRCLRKSNSRSARHGVQGLGMIKIAQEVGWG
jgi:DNA invertase Pin-like site-specific DNA recombinase